MNERPSDSSGLPLRAMVMVLLFLGVVFLLVGFQAMGSSDDSSSNDSPVAVSSTSTPSPTPSASPAPAVKADVRVYNISETAGAAENTANQLRSAGWNVTETGNLTMEGVTATTVYFSDAPGEREAAEEVGKLLAAPVEPRAPELAEQPPGVVVAVTG
ncbi:MAG: LytR C-terminal domain-containing protein [Mycobacterium sp.]